MVAPKTMTRAATVLAIGYLCLMAFGGRLPHKHEDSPHSEGLYGLHEGKPSEIAVLIFTRENDEFRVVHDDSGWRINALPVNESLAEEIEALTKMLARAEPVRTFHPEDLAPVKDQDYGFKQLAFSVAAESRADGPKTWLEFGYSTPDQSLRYVRKRGDPALYVMSGFLFEQTEKVHERLASLN
ncbi:MAG: hypothetical protein AAF387_11395 [Pseudomonadota bacterium]